MLSIVLNAQDEYMWLGENPSPDTFPAEQNRYPLYHQWRTYKADKPIIVNTYNTGTGKTKAGLLRLLKRARDKGSFDKLRPSQDNALLIAPTNELLAQHVEDARAFCKENNLPYRVLALTKPDLDAYMNMPDFSEERLRRGAVLQSVLTDPGRVGDDTMNRATLYVVNPDIFYYAMLFCYGQFDRAGLFEKFFRLFNYIIIDEFHYYSPKQLATFLFFMKFSQHEGYIDSNAKKRQFCILTATPHPRVTCYLESLNIPITWIKPGEIDAPDLPLVQPVRALTSVQLQVYSTEELQQGTAHGGLLQLVELRKQEIRGWVQQGLEGAIISSSLGTINRIHALLSSSGVSPEHDMGRITGAELREGRNEAKERSLILATPTVDIGYNFERSTHKPRQNIDFLLIDAHSGDELIQRLGRAGRVLAKEERNHESVVLVVVEPTVYTLLQTKAQTEAVLERIELARLAVEEMPKRNDLYAYIKTGAILEVFRPIDFLSTGMSDTRIPDFERFLADIQQIFEVNRTFTLKDAKNTVRVFEERKKCYGEFTTIPEEAFDILRLYLKKPIEDLTPTIEKYLKAFQQRLQQASRQELGRDYHEVIRWVKCDVRQYFIDKARFSFRDSFQPPLALLYDPEHLHSSKDTASYSALHIIKYYEAHFYETVEAWRVGHDFASQPETSHVVAYCTLQKHRDEPLRIGLKLDASEYIQDEWEEQFAYQVTAIYGLEIVVLDDNHGLTSTLQAILRTQFVSAFVALNDAKSSTASELRKLQKRARFFPLQLEVSFLDGQCRSYYAILGTMAFQVCAEIPRRSIFIDRRKTQLADDAPFIC